MYSVHQSLQTMGMNHHVISLPTKRTSVIEPSFILESLDVVVQCSDVYKLNDHLRPPISLPRSLSHFTRSYRVEITVLRFPLPYLGWLA